MRERESAEAPSSFGDLVGRAPAVRQLFAQGASLAAAEIAIAIAGEAGTGKDAFARALHRASARAQGPLVAVDCSGPPGLSELELFGRTAGDLAPRAGALELARGGTLLLDHLSELPRALQPRLADALAGARAAKVVRTIALNRQRLGQERERGRLDDRLVQLLAEAELIIPPLRDRREDIPLLARALLERSEEGRGLTLSNEALDLLCLHDWPGNVRELRNVLERFVLAVQGGDPSARKLAALVFSGELPTAERREWPSEAASFEPGASYREERARFEAAFERRYVAWLLERHDGNLSAASRAAEMDRKYLDKLARRHGLKPAR